MRRALRAMTFLLASVLLLGMATPSLAAAAAKHAVGLSGIRPSYSVAAGKPLSLGGHLYSAYHDNNWLNHGAELQLQRYSTASRSWVTLRTVRPSRWGWFSISQAPSATGSYRVRYNGCGHFYAKSVYLKVVRPTPPPVAKVDPRFAVTLEGASSLPDTKALPAASMPQAPYAYLVELDGGVSTALDYAKLAGGTLAVTIEGSHDGLSFENAATLAPLSFSSGPAAFSHSMLLAGQPIPVSTEGPGVPAYGYFRARASWTGNALTLPGAYLSPVIRVTGPAVKQDPQITVTTGSSRPAETQWAAFPRGATTLGGSVMAGANARVFLESSTGDGSWDTLKDYGQVGSFIDRYLCLDLGTGGTSDLGSVTLNSADHARIRYVRTRLVWAGNASTTPSTIIGEPVESPLYEAPVAKVDASFVVSLSEVLGEDLSVWDVPTSRNWVVALTDVFPENPPELLAGGTLELLYQAYSPAAGGWTTVQSHTVRGESPYLNSFLKDIYAADAGSSRFTKLRIVGEWSGSGRTNPGTFISQEIAIPWASPPYTKPTVPGGFDHNMADNFGTYSRFWVTFDSPEAVACFGHAAAMSLEGYDGEGWNALGEHPTNAEDDGYGKARFEYMFEVPNETLTGYSKYRVHFIYREDGNFSDTNVTGDAYPIPAGG